ncbi:MAG: hypothetical protein KKF16_11065 [Euryarchaeota archaeon]|nr:hypothetical protein [Euryarchaeota archaeon]MBV1729327.1 hypothetical protein [Methanobacterium sp.]MBU4547510.1 hypothetical protein [Euryarchaeota archaeon]MBU4607872.1 hypothetical protein [Euryarchaeota archaeon]MBV1754155.1 hypothetical protein [Methanobacterium sp.]
MYPVRPGGAHYYGKEEAASDKEEEKLKKIYEVSQIKIGDEMPFQPSYRSLTVAYQINQDPEMVYGILKRNSQLSEEMEVRSYDEIGDTARKRSNNV